MADESVDVVLQVRLQGPGFFSGASKGPEQEAALKAAMRQAMDAFNDAVNSGVVVQVDLRIGGRSYSGEGTGSQHDAAALAMEDVMAAFKAGIDSNKPWPAKKDCWLLTNGSGA